MTAGASPTLVHGGEGEVLTDSPERWVQITAARDEFALIEFRYAPGERGPKPHIHRRHSDAFWVLEGELTFELGGGEVEHVTAGGFALAPPGVVHTFRNEGPGDARFLNVHAPNLRFDDYLRGLHGVPGYGGPDESFDTFEPPADGGRPPSDAVLRAPGEGEELALGGSSVVFKVEKEDTVGAFSLTEGSLAPAFPGPVAHRHRSMVDSFYVLDGSLTLRLEDDTVEATAGTYALVPPGVVHTFSNPGSDRVRFLNLMAPAGFEQYLKEVVAALPKDGAPDPAVMARIASRYDFEPV